MNKRSEDAGCFAGAVVLTVWLLACIGYIFNLVAIAQEWVWPPDGEMLVRLIGVFVPPVGAVMGFF